MSTSRLSRVSRNPTKRKIRPEIFELRDRGRMSWKNVCESLNLYRATVNNNKQAAKFSSKKINSDIGLSLNFRQTREASMKIINENLDRIKALQVVAILDTDAREVFSKVLAKDLQILGFSLSGKSRDGVLEALINSLEECSALQVFMLIQGTVSPHHANRVIRNLSHSSGSIHTINMTGIKLEADCGTQIAAYLKDNTTLEVLSLKDNRLGTEGAISILEALLTNRTLKMLDLTKNDILGGVAFALHDAIVSGAKVRLLSLSDNAIDIDGASMIMNAIRIRKVFLARQYFMKNPEKFKELTKIDFKGQHKVQPEHKKIFEELAEDTIWELELTKNSIDGEDLRNLFEVLDAPLMTIFRSKEGLKEELTWSNEAWHLATSEIGPKYIVEAAAFLLETMEDEVKQVVQSNNHMEESIVEVLLKNKYHNEDVFEAIKFFCVKCEIRPEDKDSLGRPYIEVMRHHENKAISRWANEMGALDGKYKFKPLPPLHVSSTAEILLVDRVEDNKEVVIKIYRERENLERELAMRQALKDTKMGETLSKTKEYSDKSDCILRLLDHSEKESKYLYAIYEKAEKSLFDIMNTERIAGIDLPSIKRIMKKAAQCLGFMNNNGIMHGDFKPKSFLRLNYHSKDFKLIDFDSSAYHGDELEGTMAPAYIPPEAALAKLVLEKRIKNGESLTKEQEKTATLVASEKFDVWSFGVVLFEMLSGLTLFESIKASDTLASTSAKADLINWLEIPSSQLERILEIPEKRLKSRDVFFAREIVRWCLQRNPENRPSFNQILAHPFFTNLPESKVHLSKNFRTHMFLSHIQSQASGTVKDLYYCSAQLGCTAWLDMKAGQITQQAMYDGVQNTEAFVVCVTKDIFYSMFCLKEFMWALDFEKKMIFMLEVDPRELLFPFNRKEFSEKFSSESQLDKLSSGLGEFDELMMSGLILREVEANAKKIESEYAGNTVKFVLKELVFRQINNVLESGDCIPYRRREYENVAMMNYLLERIGFIPPSDSILDDRDEVAKEKVDNIIREDEKGSKEFLEAAAKKKSLTKHQVTMKRLKKTMGKGKRDKNRKNRLLNKNSKSKGDNENEEGVLESFTGTIFVLIGRDIAGAMCTSLRESIQQYIQLVDINSQWLEFGPDEEVSFDAMNQALDKGKVAVLCFITPDFFNKTTHGPNLLGLESILKKRKIKSDFPVVMVQEGFFGRAWGLIQEEVGTKYNHYLLDVEFMPYRDKELREYEHYAMVGEVASRINEYCDVYAV